MNHSRRARGRIAELGLLLGAAFSVIGCPTNGDDDGLVVVPTVTDDFAASCDGDGNWTVEVVVDASFRGDPGSADDPRDLVISVRVEPTVLATAIADASANCAEDEHCMDHRVIEDGDPMDSLEWGYSSVDAEYRGEGVWSAVVDTVAPDCALGGDYRFNVIAIGTDDDSEGSYEEDSESFIASEVSNTAPVIDDAVVDCIFDESYGTWKVWFRMTAHDEDDGDRVGDIKVITMSPDCEEYTAVNDRYEADEDYWEESVPSDTVSWATALCTTAGWEAHFWVEDIVRNRTERIVGSIN